MPVLTIDGQTVEVEKERPFSMQRKASILKSRPCATTGPYPRQGLAGYVWSKSRQAADRVLCPRVLTLQKTDSRSKPARTGLSSHDV